MFFSTNPLIKPSMTIKICELCKKPKEKKEQESKRNTFEKPSLLSKTCQCDPKDVFLHRNRRK